MAYVKQAPAAKARLAASQKNLASAKTALATEKASPALSVAQDKKFKRTAKVNAGGRGQRHLTLVQEGYDALAAPFLAAEAARISQKSATITALTLEVPRLSAALSLAQMADDAEIQRVAVAAAAKKARIDQAAIAAAATAAAKAAAEKDAALLRAKDARLGGRISQNTTAADLNNQQIVVSNKRMNAVEAAATSPATSTFKPNAADKAAAVVLETKAKAISKKSIELAAVDKYATAQAAAAFSASPPKSKVMQAVPALAGALIGFKVGGMTGAAIGAGAGFLLKGKGA